MFTFCQRLYDRKCHRRKVGGQKNRNLANVVCERPQHATMHTTQRGMFVELEPRNLAFIIF